MFSNPILNKYLMNQEPKATPEFNRYCEVNGNAVKEVARSGICDDISNMKRKRSQSKESERKQINTHAKIEGGDQNQLDKYLSSGQEQQNMNSKQESNQKIQNQQLKQQNQELVEIEEQSNEFLQLKEQMFNIQSLATKQITRLKAQLMEKEEQIDKLINIIQNLKQNHEPEESTNVRENKDQIDVTEIGINTENDFKDEQIKSLKEALVRHIRINKDLTKKIGGGCKQNIENNKNASNLNSSISKLVSKIQI